MPQTRSSRLIDSGPGVRPCRPLRGEELAVILPNQTLRGAASVAERIRIAVEQSCSIDSTPGRQVTVSIGASACVATDVISPAQLISQADAALYRAKQGGRNQVILLELT